MKQMLLILTTTICLIVSVAKAGFTQEAGDPRMEQALIEAHLKLMELSKTLGKDHPSVAAAAQKVEALKKLAWQSQQALGRSGLGMPTIPVEVLEQQQMAERLKKSIQRFSTLVEQLGPQLEELERLGNEMGLENKDTRKKLFQAADDLIGYGKQHIGELKQSVEKRKERPATGPGAIGDVSEEWRDQVGQAAIDAMLAAQSDVHSKAVRDAMLHMNALQELEKKLAGQERDRIDTLEDRLERIEALLERVLDQKAPGRDSSGGGEPGGGE